MEQNIIDYIGKVLIVDDNFNKDIKKIIEKLAQKGLSVQYWDSKEEKTFSNIRVLILDLDLSNGVTRRGDPFYYTMAAGVLKQIPGPYVVMIYAQDFVEKDIEQLEKAYLDMTDEHFGGKITGMNGMSKNNSVEKITEHIQEMIEKSTIFNLILTWEKIIDKAKDFGLEKFLKKESQSDLTNFVQKMKDDVQQEGLPREFISNMLRFLNRHMYKGTEYGQLKILLEKLTSSPETEVPSQFLQNKMMYFKPNVEEKCWTGDIFKDEEEEFWMYSIILTPECDIAQDKVENYLICKGFSMDHENLKNPDHPIHKVSKSFELLKNEETPQKKLKALDFKNRHDRLFSLWNCTEDFKKYFGICFNFQHVSTVKVNDVDQEFMERRISRLDYPFITEMIRQFSNYSTRPATPAINLPHL